MDHMQGIKGRRFESPVAVPETKKRPDVRALPVKLAEEEGFPRRFATLYPSFAGSVGQNPKNVPLARFLNGFPPYRFESPVAVPETKKRPDVRALPVKLAEEEGFPRRFATLYPSFAGSVGQNPKNVPLARFLNGFPPYRFESPVAVPETKKRPDVRALPVKLAEEEGFEPSSPGLRVKRFSRPPHSTTLPPLRRDVTDRFSKVDHKSKRQPIRSPLKVSGGEMGI